MAVTLSIANHAASLPVAYRLYLPQDWAADPIRRAKAQVPDEVGFLTKPEIALAQIRAALAAKVAEVGIDAEISGREKKPYAIWRKMENRQISLEQLSDIYGFRVIVEE